MKSAIDNRQIRFVFQKGIGLTSGEDPAVRYLQTEDVGSCVSVIGYSADTRKTALAHLDTTSDVAEAARLFMQHFGNSPVELSLIGGQKTRSEGLVGRVIGKFADHSGWTVARAELLPDSGYKRQILVDTLTGKVYRSTLYHEMYPWGWNPPAAIQTRRNIGNSMQQSLVQDYPIIKVAA